MAKMATTLAAEMGMKQSMPIDQTLEDCYLHHKGQENALKCLVGCI